MCCQGLPAVLRRGMSLNPAEEAGQVIDRNASTDVGQKNNKKVMRVGSGLSGQ